jgi:hypothetical protein
MGVVRSCGRKYGRLTQTSEYATQQAAAQAGHTCRGGVANNSKGPRLLAEGLKCRNTRIQSPAITAA